MVNPYDHGLHLQYIMPKRAVIVVSIGKWRHMQTP